MQGPKSQPPKPSGVDAFVGVVFGAVFTVMGLAVIGGLGMMSGRSGMPSIFSLFPILIGIAFVALGGSVVWKCLQGLLGDPAERPAQRNTAVPSQDSPAPPPLSSDVGYVCPHCGAPLGDKADVSPHGDVKCGYCATWFNIHQA